MLYLVCFIISLCLKKANPEIDKETLITTIFFADKLTKIIHKLFAEIKKDLDKKEETSSKKEEVLQRNKQDFSKDAFAENIIKLTMINVAITTLIPIATIIIVLIYYINQLG